MTPRQPASCEPIISTGLTNTHARHWGLRRGRLGLGISLGGVSSSREWQQLLGWVDRAEMLGLHSVWIPEMHFAPGVSTSPLLVLAACAARSRSLRLGTTSLLLPIRPPLRVAEEVAALDRLSNGRVILGLGRGFRAPLFDAFSIDAATKRDRFDAALDLILARWAGEPVSLAGTPFRGTDDPGQADDPESARPLQSPHPPLAVAAFGRKGLAQAARRALPYLASPLEPLDLISSNVEFHRRNMPPDAQARELVVPVMRTVYIAGSDAEVKRVYEGLEKEARAGRQGKLPAAITQAAAADIGERVIVGMESRVLDLIAAYRERLGMDLLIARPQIANVSQREREAALERLVSSLENT